MFKSLDMGLLADVIVLEMIIIDFETRKQFCT